jgi:hypothetical protein
MKIWQAIVLGCAVLQSVPAEAGFWRDLPSLQSQSQGQGRTDRGDRGPQRQRDAGQPERFERHQQHQRMSDDERRDLHRDLDKARREIYQPRRER